MRLLLDTHAFLWAVAKPSALGGAAVAAITSAENDVYLSAVVAWEIAIKYRLGKLALPMPPETYVVTRMRVMRFQELPVSLQHAAAVATLAGHHEDPFDRLLIAQAQIESMTLVTADPNVLKYAVNLLDARR